MLWCYVVHACLAYILIHSLTISKYMSTLPGLSGYVYLLLHKSGLCSKLMFLSKSEQECMFPVRVVHNTLMIIQNHTG